MSRAQIHASSAAEWALVVRAGMVACARASAPLAVAARGAAGRVAARGIGGINNSMLGWLQGVV